MIVAEVVGIVVGVVAIAGAIIRAVQWLTKGDLDLIKRDVADLQHDHRNAKTEINAINTVISAQGQRISKVESSIQAIEKSQARTEDTVNKIYDKLTQR